MPNSLTINPYHSCWVAIKYTLHNRPGFLRVRSKSTAATRRRSPSHPPMLQFPSLRRLTSWGNNPYHRPAADPPKSKKHFSARKTRCWPACGPSRRRCLPPQCQLCTASSVQPCCRWSPSPASSRRWIDGVRRNYVCTHALFDVSRQYARSPSSRVPFEPALSLRDVFLLRRTLAVRPDLVLSRDHEWSGEGPPHTSYHPPLLTGIVECKVVLRTAVVQ